MTVLPQDFGGQYNMKKETLFLLLLGGAAGFVNGLLGTGGGIILLFGSLLLSRGQKTDTRDRFAGTALVTMLLSVVSAILYAWQGKIAVHGLSSYLAPALVGGVVGAVLLDRLPTTFIERLFAVLVMVAGGLMLFR